jgi:hypothetical protein
MIPTFARLGFAAASRLSMKSKDRRIVKRGRLITGMAAAIPVVAATGFAAPAAAHASQDGAQRADNPLPNGKSVVLTHRPQVVNGAVWASLTHSDTLYIKSGGSIVLPRHEFVFVTCYYSGAPYADPYWDHVTKEVSSNGYTTTYTGHLADRYVSLGGYYPKSVGIPHCTT